MASYIPPVVHATGDAFAVTDNNALAGDAVFLYQRPYFNYFNSVATSLPNTTLTQVTIGGTTTSGYGFSVSSNNVICPLTGIYWVAGTVQINSTTNSLIINLEHNGTPFAVQFGTAGGATGVVSSTVSAAVSCTAGDTLALFAEQTSGGTISTTTGAQNTFISGFFLGSQ